ncbi:MAG: MBL fold metallo-hydrolase [bacterium]
MAGHDILVRFWGVRGSHPVPGTTTLRHGGNTSCVEIRTREHVIILDAGTGIINLGNKLIEERRSSKNTPSNITLIFSHTHHDHIQGLPFFSPAYEPDCRLHIYGPKSLSENLDHILSKAMSLQYSPIEFNDLTAGIEIHNIMENDVLCFEGRTGQPELLKRSAVKNISKYSTLIRFMRSYGHPRVGVFIFKIEVNGKSVVYATDTEGYVGTDTRLVRFAQNSNLLIHDSQYTPGEYLDVNFPRQGFGHSTYEMAAHVAREAGVKNLVLFHHDPSHDDEKISEMEARAKALFPQTTAGAEGLEFTF